MCTFTTNKVAQLPTVLNICQNRLAFCLKLNEPSKIAKDFKYFVKCDHTVLKRNTNQIIFTGVFHEYSTDAFYEPGSLLKIPEIR